MSNKELTSVLLSGLAVTGGVLATVATGGAAPIAGLIFTGALAALGGIGGNLLSSYLEKKFVNPTPKDEILRNGDLTRAVGKAVFILINDEANSSDYGSFGRIIKHVGESEGEEWEKYVTENIDIETQETDEKKPVYAKLKDLLPSQLTKYIKAETGKIDNLQALTPETWAIIVKGIFQSQSYEPNDEDCLKMGERLHQDFPQALRKVLIDDFSQDGKAYASMQFRILSETLHNTEENYEVSQNILLIVRQLSKKVDEINQNSPNHYSSQNIDNWEEIIKDFQDFGEKLNKIYQNTEDLKSYTKDIKSTQSEHGILLTEQNENLSNVQETVDIIRDIVENRALSKDSSEFAISEDFLSYKIQEINQSFLESQRRLNNFSRESFYLANSQAQWWGILNDLDEKTELFHEVKQQIKDKFYYDAPILAYFEGLGGAGKTTLARQIVVDFVLSEKHHNCWWIKCDKFDETENAYIKKHLKAINDSSRPTLVVLDDWKNLENSTKMIFKRLFSQLNDNSSNLKFIITDRNIDPSESLSQFLSKLYSFNELSPSNIDNNAILQKLFDLPNKNYQTVAKQLFNEKQISTARPFFLLYVLLKAVSEPDILKHLSNKNEELSNETDKAKRYFNSIITFDLKKLCDDKEKKGLVLALGFIAYLDKKHKQNLTKNAFLLLAREESETTSKFNLLDDYFDKSVNEWDIVGQYVYLKEDKAARKTEIPDKISFNKDDFVDALLEANIFGEYSISKYIEDRKAQISRFLIENADKTAASIVAYVSCYLEDTLKKDAKPIIQHLLDKQNTHPTYSKIFLNENENLFDDNQKWVWIEQFFGFSKTSYGFQINCTNWIKTAFKDNKQKRLQALNRLAELGATIHNLINAILFATEGKEQIKKARELLETSKDSSVICNCLRILSDEPDIKNIAGRFLNPDGYKEVLCLCLDILRNERGIKNFARKLYNSDLDHSVICKILKILKNESDIKNIAKTLLKINKDREVINSCLDILKNELDIEDIVKTLLETSRNPQVICKCAEITQNAELARQLVNTKNQNIDIICKSLEILKNEPDINVIINKLINPNTHHQVNCKILEITKNIELAKQLLAKEDQKKDVICRCLPILKETFEGKKYALNVLANWKEEDSDIVKRSLEVLAETQDSELVIQEIIINNKKKRRYLYERIMNYNHKNSDSWQKEVFTILKYWRNNNTMVVGYCLRHSENDYASTVNPCLDYLSNWQYWIKQERKWKKSDFSFIIKALAHPNLKEKAKNNTREMLEFEKNNNGFLPADLKQVAESIQKGNFPKWHTNLEVTEIKE